MKKLNALIKDEVYRQVRQYQLDQAAKGRKLRIAEVVNELLERGLSNKAGTALP
ncbi:hypothetical protein [Fibrella arboris]|uniref:hypothetical protein n=1 Tax=Fibrella arboris TaxID=3242486 RepID=UPI00351F8861